MNGSRTLRRPAARGLTLLEMIVATALLVVVVGMALSTFAYTDKAVTESMLRTELMLRANRLERALNRELRGAVVSEPAPESPNPSPGGDITRVAYAPITGWTPGSPGAVVTGPPRELRFRYDGGEGGSGSGNDVDDDRDGLVDEGRLEIAEVGAGRTLRIVLAEGVSGDDIRILKDGNHLTVRYTLEARASATTLVREERKLVLALRNN